jgi:hypothetical protein
MQYVTPFEGYKKTQILVRRKEELRHALKHDATGGKIAKAAEGVRNAKLQLIKALHQSLSEQKMTDRSVTDQLKTLQRESELWKRISTDEIIKRNKTKRA